MAKPSHFKSGYTEAYKAWLRSDRRGDPPHPWFDPDVAGLLTMKAAAPLKPAKPQLPCDVGLFSDDADQLDLVQWLTEQSED